MNTTLTVNGIHCEACQKLIAMDLEDAGLSEKMTGVEMKEGNVGVVSLENVSEEEIVRIKEVINGMEGYTVS